MPFVKEDDRAALNRYLQLRTLPLIDKDFYISESAWHDYLLRMVIANNNDYWDYYVQKSDGQMLKRPPMDHLKNDGRSVWTETVVLSWAFDSEALAAKAAAFYECEPNSFTIVRDPRDESRRKVQNRYANFHNRPALLS